MTAEGDDMLVAFFERKGEVEAGKLGCCCWRRSSSGIRRTGKKKRIMRVGLKMLRRV